MKIILGRQIEEIKKKNSEAEKILLKNRNSEDINELAEDDVYFHANTIKNIKLGSNTVNRIYLNDSIVYELEDTIILNLFHSLVPQSATSIIFDKIENQDVSGYNLVGYCDANNNIAVYNNNTEYLVLNMRNAFIYSPKSLSSFFYSYSVLSHCVFNNFNTDNVTNMSNMFYNCKSLPSLDISNFNTDNVTNMGSMFLFCEGLKSLNISNFNTVNVTYMGAMFGFCKGLPSLDISNFYTDNVTNMSEMFQYCSALTRLDISNFNTDNVKNMSRMFSHCSSLKTIISNTFSLLSLTSSGDMFGSCTALVGGKGTKYNRSHSTAEYARVDGVGGLPGYFTAPTV